MSFLKRMFACSVGFEYGLGVFFLAMWRLLNPLFPHSFSFISSLSYRANDTVNSGAIEDENSPISGMPVLRVWDARKCVVVKRTMGQVRSPLFSKIKIIYRIVRQVSMKNDTLTLYMCP